MIVLPLITVRSRSSSPHGRTPFRGAKGLHGKAAARARANLRLTLKGMIQPHKSDGISSIWRISSYGAPDLAGHPGAKVVNLVLKKTTFYIDGVTIFLLGTKWSV